MTRPRKEESEGTGTLKLTIPLLNPKIKAKHYSSHR